MAHKLQKLFYYSSEENKQFIESILEYISSAENRSVSSLIEDYVLNALLPENEEGRSILYYYFKGDKALRDTLGVLFGNNAAGINWYSKYANYKPLVEFAYKYCENSKTIQNPEGLHYFFDYFEEVVKMIESTSKSCVEIQEQNYFNAQARMARSMFEAAKEDYKNIDCKRCFELILDCWDMLYDCTFTFRFLNGIVGLEKIKWKDTETSRYELYSLICNLSEEWTEDNYAHKIRV